MTRNDDCMREMARVIRTNMFSPGRRIAKKKKSSVGALQKTRQANLFFVAQYDLPFATFCCVI